MKLKYLIMLLFILGCSHSWEKDTEGIYSHTTYTARSVGFMADSPGRTILHLANGSTIVLAYQRSVDYKKGDCIAIWYDRGTAGASPKILPCGRRPLTDKEIDERYSRPIPKIDIIIWGGLIALAIVIWQYFNQEPQEEEEEEEE